MQADMMQILQQLTLFFFFFFFEENISMSMDHNEFWGWKM